MSFAFSNSSSFSLFTSAGANPAKCFRQTYRVCSLTLFFFAASATEVRSASLRMATICSSVNRLLRIGSSLRKEPFFQKLMGRRNGSGPTLAPF